MRRDGSETLSFLDSQKRQFYIICILSVLDHAHLKLFNIWPSGVTSPSPSDVFERYTWRRRGEEGVAVTRRQIDFVGGLAADALCKGRKRQVSYRNSRKNGEKCDLGV